MAKSGTAAAIAAILGLASAGSNAAAETDRREDISRTAPGAYGPQTPGTADARPWALDLSVITGFDSNPSLTIDDDPRSAGSGGFLGMVASGSYRLYREAAWTVRASGVAFASYPFEAPDFSVAAIRPTLGADYAFSVGRVPVTAFGSYGLDATFVGGAFFNLGHAFTVGAQFPVAPFVTAAPAYTFSAIDFDEDARDTTRHRIGVTLSGPVFFIRDPYIDWSLGYGFTRNNADNNFYIYDSHAISGTLGIRLRPGLLALRPFASSLVQLVVSYSGSDYFRYPTSPQRRDDIVTLSAAFATPITPQLHAAAVVVHYRADSTLANYEARRTTLTFALTWKF